MNKLKKVILPGAVGLTAFAGIAGGSLMNTLSANADTASTTGDTSTTAAADDTSTATTAAATTSTDSSTSMAQPDPSKGGHTANGVTETVLTGDTATKAIAAAKAAVPGATVMRAETDAEGASYEVHMTKSDGSQVTVKLDSSFNITSTEDGMGAGGPAKSSTSSTSSST
jgi:uncharacterized membrane protein YkoI